MNQLNSFQDENYKVQKRHRKKKRTDFLILRSKNEFHEDEKEKQNFLGSEASQKQEIKVILTNSQTTDIVSKTV